MTNYDCIEFRPKSFSSKVVYSIYCSVCCIPRSLRPILHISLFPKK